MSATAEAGERYEEKEMMNPNKLICAGGAGSVVTAICCFTPVLVIGLGAVGLSAWLGWLDYVLFPMLAAFLGLTAYGLWRGQRTASAPPLAKEERS